MRRGLKVPIRKAQCEACVALLTQTDQISRFCSLDVKYRDRLPDMQSVSISVQNREVQV